MTSELKPFLEDMLSMSTCTDGRTLQIHFSRPITNDDRKALMDAHNAAVTRAVPDVPELVRYGFWKDGTFEEDQNGKYVRHDQAVTVIAAKDDRLRKSEQDKVGMLAHIAELEAKLAQSEKPEAVAWRHKVSVFGDETAWRDGDGEGCYPDEATVIVQPLYAAPVASYADLRAENDKLRQAAKPFAEYGLDYFDKDNTGSPLPDEQGVGWIYLNYGHFRALRTALHCTARERGITPTFTSPIIHRCEMTKADQLFLTDAEIAQRVGIKTDQWKMAVISLEKSGFPKPDPLFERRRYWPACRAFLDNRYDLGTHFLRGNPAQPDGEEKW